MINRKIIYICNPISGNGKKPALIKKIETLTTANKIDFDFITTNAGGDYEALRSRIYKEKITDVVIVGGDGTVNQITKSLQNCDVRFGIIPAGSGNGLAYAAGIPKKTESALEIIFKKDAQKIDAFTVGTHYACMLSGLGFDATVAHKFANLPKRGFGTYIQQTLLNFFTAKTYRFEILIGEKSFTTDAHFISIANANQFGNNVKIAPKAKLNDGLLDIVIVQKMSKAKMLYEVLKQINNINNLQQHAENINGKSILYFQAAALTIRNINNAPLHIDGDPCETANTFKIEVIKDCFALLQ